MNKFDAKGEDEADIEIAQAFHSPHQMYLNRYGFSMLSMLVLTVNLAPS